MKTTSLPAGVKRSGFSLAEVAIALGLLSFVLLAVVGLLGVGLNSGRDAQLSTVQAAAARQVLTMVSTNDLATYTGSKFWITFDGTLTNTTNNAFFECSVSTNAVTDLPNEAAGNLRALKIQFVYPLFANAANRTTNTIHATLARHD